MTALVTGATGFIGRRLAERLLERGDAVRLLVRRPDAAAALQAGGAELVVGALEDTSSLSAATAGATVVFHCAGLSTDWGAFCDFEAVNVTGARALAEAAARAATVTRFVHLSTTDVFGYPKVACGDDAPVRDAGLPYNRSKLRGEQAVMEVARATGLPVTVVRPATVYGPRSKDWAVEVGKVLLKKEMVLVRGGRARAGLLYVDDLVDALLALVASPVTAGQHYTLRDPGEETWRDYLDALSAGLGLAPPRRSLPFGLAYALGGASEALWRLVGAKSRPLLTRHAVNVFGLDQGYGISRAQADFGFAPKVGFAEGVARTVAWLHSPEGAAALQ